VPRVSRAERELVQRLLSRHGQTYAEESGIRLADRPGPLYQLLVVSTLLSARISSNVALAAARELFADGYKTPAKMLEASWQDRVDALGRGHYRRYDERTSTLLGEAAEMCQRRWGGDVRQLRERTAGNVDRMRRYLTEFPGIGPTGADIFLREVQAVWPEVAPYFDRRALAGAAKLSLPTSPEALARLVDADHVAALASALVRVNLDHRVEEDVRSAAKVAAS
jgi:endonuclease III